MPTARPSALEAMDYVVSTMHMQGFSRMFRPGNYAPTEADHDTVKARGKEIMEKGLALMDKALEGKEYVAGKFSVADAALFYVTFWAAGRMKMPLPKNVAAHYERMKNRPAVKRTRRAGRPDGRRLTSPQISLGGSPRDGVRGAARRD